MRVGGTVLSGRQGAAGRPRGAEVMLRMYLLLFWFNLSIDVNVLMHTVKGAINRNFFLIPLSSGIPQLVSDSQIINLTFRKIILIVRLFKGT